MHSSIKNTSYDIIKKYTSSCLTFDLGLFKFCITYSPLLESDVPCDT